MKNLNIHQYGNYSFAAKYEDIVKDVEKCSKMFQEMIEGLSCGLYETNKQIVI